MFSMTMNLCLRKGSPGPWRMGNVGAAGELLQPAPPNRTAIAKSTHRFHIRWTPLHFLHLAMRVLTPPVDIRALHKSSRPVSQPFSAPARDGRAFTRYSGPPTNLRSAVTRDGSAPARNEFQFLFFSAAVSQHTVALICRSRPLDKVHSAATQDSFHKIFSSAASIQLRVARDRSSRPLDKVPRPVTQDACHRISFARGPTRSDQLGAIPKCTSDAVWFAVTLSVNESSVVRL